MDFHELLQSELIRRQAGNPRYSLRAFARHLGIDHSALSQILRKRRRLTGRVMRRLGAALGVPAAVIDRAALQANAEALAGVVRDPAFRADCRWIASKLGIPLDEVQVALHEVVRTGRVVMRSHQRWEAMNG